MAFMNFGNRSAENSTGNYDDRSDSPVLSGGMARGLSYVIPWAQEENMMLREQALDRQAHKDIEAKAKLLGQDIKLPKVDDSYVGQKLKEYSQGQLKKLGQFVTENPDFQSDPGKWIQYKSLADSVANNDYAVRLAKVKDEYGYLTKYMKDNSNDLNDPNSGLRDELQRYSNWKKTGNFESGQSGAEKNQQDYMFTKPKQWDYDKDMRDMGSKAKGTKNEWISNDKTLYGTITSPDKDEIQALAIGYLKDPFTLKHAYDLYHSSALTDDQRRQYGNYQGMVTSAIEAYMPKGIDIKGAYKQQNINIHNYTGSGNAEQNTNLLKPYLDGVDAMTQPASFKNLVLTNYIGKGTASDNYMLKPCEGGSNPIMFSAAGDKGEKLGKEITDDYNLTDYNVVISPRSAGKIIEDNGKKYVQLTVYAQKKITPAMKQEIADYAMSPAVVNDPNKKILVDAYASKLTGSTPEMQVYVPVKPKWEVDEKDFDELSGFKESTIVGLQNQTLEQNMYKQSQQQQQQNKKVINFGNTN